MCSAQSFPKPSRPRGAAPASRLDGPSQVLTGNVGDGCLVGSLLHVWMALRRCSPVMSGTAAWLGGPGDQGGAGRASAVAKLLQDPRVFGKERGGGEGRASPGKFPVRGEGAAPGLLGSNGWVKVVLVGGGRRGHGKLPKVRPSLEPAASACGGWGVARRDR